MILLIDNYDSFTYNLVDYFNQLGTQCSVKRNDEELDLDIELFNAIVLSPGPGTPHTAGNLLGIVNHYVEKRPMLGICLGHQAIGEYFGSRLIKAERPMHGKISRITHVGDPIFKDLANPFEAVRYNSLILEDVQSPLIETATSDSGEVMALRHNVLPVWGLQFHPEAVMTKFGLKMLSNWLEYNKLV